MDGNIMEEFKSRYYTLDNENNPIPCSIEEWASQREIMVKNDNKHVGYEFIDGKTVSTVWLGLDHGYPYLSGNTENYRPLIFETMVFDGDDLHEIYLERYSTWKEAEEGHQKAVEWVKNGCKEID
jgi:hypothetical protein